MTDGEMLPYVLLLCFDLIVAIAFIIKLEIKETRKRKEVTKLDLHIISEIPNQQNH